MTTLPRCHAVSVCDDKLISIIEPELGATGVAEGSLDEDGLGELARDEDGDGELLDPDGLADACWVEADALGLDVWGPELDVWGLGFVVCGSGAARGDCAPHAASTISNAEKRAPRTKAGKVMAHHAIFRPRGRRTLVDQIPGRPARCFPTRNRFTNPIPAGNRRPRPCR